MPAQHFAALIRRLHPDTSVRQLTEAAGLTENRIAYYLKPSTTVTRVPPADAITEIAAALGCDPVEVVQAFAADVNLPWSPPPLSDEERDLLRVVRQLARRDRRTLRLIATALLTAAEVEESAR